MIIRSKQDQNTMIFTQKQKIRTWTNEQALIQIVAQEARSEPKLKSIELKMEARGWSEKA